MKPQDRGPRLPPERTEIACPNCGHRVTVVATNERASCMRCANVWNWKTKRLIRGQREGAGR